VQKRYFCFECGTNVVEDKMENRIADWFGICKRCISNKTFSNKTFSVSWINKRFGKSKDYSVL